jgi:DNA helicase-2/ATP-dependent DNA helicase PcrA
MFTPRPKQQEILAYRGGKMGVSAVPGSGKTQILSYLAAEIIAKGLLQDDQEVLVVTLVNAAVDNFSRRVSAFVQQRGLLPYLGYRVRTLHGLAHDIVRERPGLVGLDEDFQIIDERASDQIREEVARAWLRGKSYALDDYLNPEEETRHDWIRRDQLPDLVSDLASSFIRYAKDLQLTPPILRAQLERLPVPLPLAEMGCAIYADYQRALAYRGAVDFDDLIRLALQALELDGQYLQRLRQRWPYILEDEAQDSSRLQEKILRLLVGGDGNWVRVGDPNQAIFETFTTASPQFLRDFLNESGVQAQELPNSGRSTLSIITLANHLIQWTQSEHPRPEVRHALAGPFIAPAPPGDPQPNPPDDPRQIQFIDKKLSPEREIQAVADSLARWLPAHPDETVAVLVPRNQRGFELVTELKRRALDHVELLRSTSSTRQAAGALGTVINYLSDPGSAKKLGMAYQTWRRIESESPETGAVVKKVAELLSKCRQVEDYLWPRAGRDWLDELSLPEEDVDIRAELEAFRQLARRWQGAAQLPIDQLLLSVAQDLFQLPADLAIAHKLALILRRASASHLEWRLPELSQELGVIARNERRFLGFSDEDTAIEPDRYKGKVFVTTMHKAKGLEWDRVYLMSVNNYDFPSGMANDRYISEPWYLRDHLNLEVESLDQLDVAFSTDENIWYEEGKPTHQARLDYVAERLRLLYVGLTRARRELIVTWNTGRNSERQPARPALPFVELLSFWEKHLGGAPES